MNRAFDSDESKRNAWLVPADFPRQWTQRQELDVLHANPLEYAAYKANVLKPAFDSFKRRMIGRSRVIFIGHWGVDYLIPILRDVVKDLNLFSGPFYTIPLYGQGEEPPTPPQYSFVPMYPINIGSKAERRRMSGRNVPAVVPFYPYYYWDVNWTAVPWADQAYGTRVAQLIRTGEGPSLSLGNSTTASPQLSSRFLKPDQRQRLHARQLEGTNATTPIPKPPTAPDDDTVDTDPVYNEDLLAFPDTAEQACVVGEPVAASSSGTGGSQSPAAGVVPANGAPADGGVATA
ncbi:MAG: hypothetical protein OHK93_003747 [Ramalina farinacea]|uniref:Uncharacterized protein n=1 Tax=Ramalina farinacea TaxID=258253 RepID=A0AA43QX34_9LECA|nr:hypothetical protein [Ramalina farinacea]